MTPQIIRNLAELKALDPETLVQRLVQRIRPEPAGTLAYIASRKIWGEYFPAVVLVTGDQVRAARKALEEAMNDQPACKECGNESLDDEGYDRVGCDWGPAPEDCGTCKKCYCDGSC